MKFKRCIWTDKVKFIQTENPKYHGSFFKYSPLKILIAAVNTLGVNKTL